MDTEIEFHDIFHIFLLTFFFNPFKKVKTILDPQALWKQAKSLLCPAGYSLPTPGLEPWGERMGVGGALKGEEIEQKDFQEIAKHGYCQWEFTILLRISKIHTWNCLGKIKEPHKVNEY